MSARQALRTLLSACLRPARLKLAPRYIDWPDIWAKDAAFIDAMTKIEGITLVPRERCFVLHQLARTLEGSNGDFAEIGVYKGGTAYLTARAAPGKTIHLFDTFEGMPEVDAGIDAHRTGDFADTRYDDVRSFLAPFRERIAFHKGFFPATAAGLEEKTFALVYVDVDIHQSVKDALAFFYPRLVPGGVMLFDDFDSPKCQGVRKAIEEFLADKPERPVVTAYYQAMIIKAAAVS